MKKYWNIYKVLLKLNFSSLVAYRGNFINSFIGNFSWAIFSIISIYILTARIDSLYGWSKEELLLLTGLFNIVNGINRTLFSRNIDAFAEVVHYAELDGVLTKPIDSQFMLSFWKFNYLGLSRLLLGIVFTGFIITTSQFNVSITSIIFFLIASFFGLAILYATAYLVITLTIWFPRLNNLTDFLYTTQGITRYPTQMFREVSEYIFLFVFPFAISVSVPAQIFFQKALILDILLLFLTGAMLLLASRLFWKFALRFYTSASG